MGCMGPRLAVFFFALSAAGAAGCGGDAPPPPAHSDSFLPVRGTIDGGGPADVLEWTYRINDGQAVPYGAIPGSTIAIDDAIVQAVGGRAVTQSTRGRLSSPDGLTGSVSTQTVDHLSDASPPAILQSDVTSSASIAIAGRSGSSRVMLMYGFTAMPVSTFFDRSDLDTLPLGFSEAQDAPAIVTGTITSTGSGGNDSQTVSLTIDVMHSWTLLEQLAAFQVRGRTFNNVVRVQASTVSGDPVSGLTATSLRTIWLAKGIGMIRDETVVEQQTGTDQGTTELLDTNLVAP